MVWGGSPFVIWYNDVVFEEGQEGKDWILCCGKTNGREDEAGRGKYVPLLMAERHFSLQLEWITCNGTVAVVKSLMWLGSADMWLVLIVMWFGGVWLWFLGSLVLIGSFFWTLWHLQDSSSFILCLLPSLWAKSWSTWS